MKFSKLYKNIINEKIADVEQFKNYTVQILEKIYKFNPNSFKDFDKNDSNKNKSLVRTLLNILDSMGLEDNNPNFINKRNYMPDKFNKILFNNGNKKTYDSEWWKLTDSRKITLINKAIDEFLEKYKQMNEAQMTKSKFQFKTINIDIPILNTILHISNEPQKDVYDFNILSNSSANKSHWTKQITDVNSRKAADEDLEEIGKKVLEASKKFEEEITSILKDYGFSQTKIK